MDKSAVFKGLNKEEWTNVLEEQNMYLKDKYAFDISLAWPTIFVALLKSTQPQKFKSSNNYVTAMHCRNIPLCC